MGYRKLLAVGLLAILGLCSRAELAWGQSDSPQLGVSLLPAATLPASVECTPSPAPRGLLQQATSASAYPEHFTPFMLGDFIEPRFNMFSDVKIAEGESPRPMTRAIYKFNYYNNIENTRAVDPIERVKRVDLYRNVFGFEQALFDNRFSLGLRVPFNTLDAQGDPRIGPEGLPGSRGYTTTQFGNVSAVAKAVLWEDRATGSLLSGGITLSFPTASSKKVNPGMSTLAFAQPFVGYIAQRGDFFVQGFSSVTMSVASAQSIVLFNDIGVGYYAYRNTSDNALLTAITPTLEVHVFTPLKQADPNASVFGVIDNTRLNNIVNITGGATFEFSKRTTLGAGVVVPVTGPKPFDVEAILQLNYRF